MRFSKEDANLGIDTTRIFAAIFVMKKLYLDRSAWNDFVTNLQALIEQYSDVDCKLLGFCDDWQKILKA
jgi:abortive infection bacteriophage resistance protein